REGGIAADADPLDRVHLHGDVQAHRCPEDMFRYCKLSGDRISHRRRKPRGYAAECVLAPPAWHRNGYRGCRSSAFRASHASAAAAMRRRWRSVTDHAASSSLSRALTSTNTSRLRRRAMMSISPTGLLQRRAKMRKPLAMRNAAARLSVGAKRDLALGARNLDRACARALIGHGRAPWRARERADRPRGGTRR